MEIKQPLKVRTVNLRLDIHKRLMLVKVNENYGSLSLLVEELLDRRVKKVEAVNDGS